MSLERSSHLFEDFQNSCGGFSDGYEVTPRLPSSVLTCSRMVSGLTLALAPAAEY